MPIKKKKQTPYDFTYSKEFLEKYRKAPTAWKLRWLEEVNRLTWLALTPEEKAFREKVRRGEISA